MEGVRSLPLPQGEDWLVGMMPLGAVLGDLGICRATGERAGQGLWGVDLDRAETRAENHPAHLRTAPPQTG